MMNRILLLAAGLIVGSIPAVQAQLLYETDFETTPAPAFNLNATLNGQNGWSVVQGAATVSNLRSGATGASGAQHVNQTTNSIIRYSLTTPSDNVLVRGKWYGAGSATLTLPNTQNAIAALIGFKSLTASTFTIEAYNGNTDSFSGPGTSFSNTVWHDIDLNIDYAAQNFDVRVNNQTYLSDVPFQSSVSQLNGFESHAENSSNTDRLKFYASDGDFDNDGVSDEEEFETNGRNPFVADGSPTLDLAYAAPGTDLDVTTPTQFFGPGKENWHRIAIADCENVTIAANFTHANNNIQLQLFDSRCRQQGQGLSVFEYRIGESFSTTNQEFITFANNRGNTELFLRVREEGSGSGSYTLFVDTVGADDQFEFNSTVVNPVALNLGTYNNLVAKDDDFYLINTTGMTNLQVAVNHDFNLGQLFFQVFDNSGTLNGFLGGDFTTNTNNLGAVVNVSGRSQVVLRVYNANLGANFYNLTVSNPGAAPESEFAAGLDSESLTPNFFPEESEDITVAKESGAKGGLVDDAFEPNDSITAVLSATPLAVNQAVSAVMADEADWYRVPLTVCENMTFNLDFNNVDGNLQLEVYEGRCIPSGGLAAQYRVGQSYSTTNNENTIYVNNTGNQFIYVRVFGEGGATNPSYTLTCNGIGQDDNREAGSTPGGVNLISLDTQYTDLISKDDDFYRINTSGSNTLNITLNHDRFLGQLFLQVLQDNGTYNEYRDQNNLAYNNFTFNADTLTINNIDVTGSNTIVLRVFAANRGTNVYDLRVDRIN